MQGNVDVRKRPAAQPAWLDTRNRGREAVLSLFALPVVAYHPDRWENGEGLSFNKRDPRVKMQDCKLKWPNPAAVRNGAMMLLPAEIEQMNRDYHVSEFEPGFLGFGSSGGGELLAFDAGGEFVE